MSTILFGYQFLIKKKLLCDIEIIFNPILNGFIL